MSPPNKRSEEDKAYWRELWIKARENLGSATAVQVILGYPRKDKHGMNYAAQHYNASMKKGVKPVDTARQRLLHQLAGEKGRAVAVSYCFNHNIKLRGLTQ